MSLYSLFRVFSDESISGVMYSMEALRSLPNAFGSVILPKAFTEDILFNKKMSAVLPVAASGIGHYLLDS